MSAAPRERLLDLFGEVTPAWERLLQADADFADAYSRYLHTAVVRAEFTPRERELLLLAHDVSVTVLDEAGVHRRVARALAAGATEEEVLTVIELATFIAIHGLTLGLPLAAELPEGRPADQVGPYWDRFEALFPGVGKGMEERLPDFYQAYRDLGALMWRRKAIEPRLRELLLVVADMENEHLFTSGASLHMRQAQHEGATEAEVVAAVALTVAAGHRTVELGLSALAAVRDAHKQGQMTTTRKN